MLFDKFLFFLNCLDMIFSPIFCGASRMLLNSKNTWSYLFFICDVVAIYLVVWLGFALVWAWLGEKSYNRSLPLKSLSCESLCFTIYTDIEGKMRSTEVKDLTNDTH